jgi:hypothetical protein
MILLWQAVIGTSQILGHYLYYSRMIIQYLLHSWRKLFAIAVDHILGHYSHHFSMYFNLLLHCYLQLRVVVIVLALRMHLFGFRTGLGLSIDEKG